MTAALAAAGALAVITAAALYLRRRPVWQGYQPAHAPGGGDGRHGNTGIPPSGPRNPLWLRTWDTFWLWRGGDSLRNAWRICSDPPVDPAGPAPRDWGESRLPSAEARTGQLAAISDAAGERVMPGRRDGIPHADADQFLPPWDDAAQPVTPEPDLPPLPGFLPAPSRPHAAPDVRGRTHDGCDLSDTGQQAALTAFSEAEIVHTSQSACRECGCDPQDPWGCDCDNQDCPCSEEEEDDTELPPAGAAGLGTRPGEDAGPPCASCDADRQDIGIAATCPCPPEPDGNAAARWHLKAHVGYVMKRKPPLREYVEATIGPGVADLNPAYAGDAAAITVPPAEDFDSLLATARAGAVSDGG